MVLVIIKALDILEYIAQDPERAYTLTEISERLDLNQATCANILKTLVSKNYVEHLGRKKGYRLGPMAFNLTNSLGYNQNLVMAAKPEMEALTDQLNEGSLLGIIRNQKRLVLHMVNSDQDLQVRSKTERDVYETASGRLLLAYMTGKEIGGFINVKGLPASGVWKEVETREDLMRALQKIQREEIVITHSAKHIIGVAVPVKKNGKAIAALSVFLPEIRFPAPRKKEIVAALRLAAERINRRLDA